MQVLRTLVLRGDKIYSLFWQTIYCQLSSRKLGYFHIKNAFPNLRSVVSRLSNKFSTPSSQALFLVEESYVGKKFGPFGQIVLDKSLLKIASIL